MEGKLFVTSIFFEVIMSTLIFKNEIESIISFIESLSILSWKGPLNNQTIFLRTLSKHFLRCAEMPKDTIMPFRDMHKLEGSTCKRKHLPCQKNKRKREEKKKKKRFYLYQSSSFNIYQYGEQFIGRGVTKHVGPLQGEMEKCMPCVCRDRVQKLGGKSSNYTVE